MTTVSIAALDQNDWWQRSFNVLIPLEVQGKEGVLVEQAEMANMRHGSIAARVAVNGKVHSLPIWALKISQPRRLTALEVSYII